MTAFTNQFDLPEVLISRNSGLNQHLLSIKSEIQEFFGSVDLKRLSAIAKQVDQAIHEYVESGNLAANIPLPEFVPLEVLRAERVEVQREVFGDFHLFVALEAQYPWPRVPAKVARYQRYLAFSQWKLIDAMRTVVFDRELPRAQSRECAEFLAFDQPVMRYAIDCIRALQIAKSAVRDADDLASPRRTKAKTRRELALQMSKAKPYLTLVSAAEDIAANLVKGKDQNGRETFYSVEWVRRWLIDANWQPQHVGAKPRR